MLLFLQITFIVLSAACAALVIPLGILLDWPWALGSALVAVLFYVLTLLCKQTRSLRGETSVMEQEDDQTQEEKISDEKE